MNTDHGSVRQTWIAITAMLMAGVFAQAIFAGAMLSGEEWARPAHKLGSIAVVAATLLAGLAGLVMLRRVPHGLRLGLTLLALAAAALLQNTIGLWSAQGANLMWAHVPLGVALVGFAGQVSSIARRLGASA